MLQLFIYRQFRFSQFRYYCKRRNIDYYEVLQVSPTSSQKEIRAAFIKLSKTKHPDVSGSKNHEEFTRINEAYNVLGKAHSRTQYDNSILNNNITYKYNSKNDIFRTMNNNPYYYREDPFERYERMRKNPRYWEDDYDYGQYDNKTKEEKDRNRIKRAMITAALSVGSVALIALQIVTVNRSVNKQREDLKNYMQTLRKRREEVLSTDNEEVYENYVRQELMIEPKVPVRNQLNEMFLNEKETKPTEQSEKNQVFNS